MGEQKYFKVQVETAHAGSGRAGEGVLFFVADNAAEAFSLARSTPGVKSRHTAVRSVVEISQEEYEAGRTFNMEYGHMRLKPKLFTETQLKGAKTATKPRDI